MNELDSLTQQKIELIEKNSTKSPKLQGTGKFSEHLKSYRTERQKVCMFGTENHLNDKMGWLVCV